MVGVHAYVWIYLFVSLVFSCVSVSDCINVWQTRVHVVPVQRERARAWFIDFLCKYNLIKRSRAYANDAYASAHAHCTQHTKASLLLLSTAQTPRSINDAPSSTPPTRFKHTHTRRQQIRTKTHCSNIWWSSRPRDVCVIARHARGVV